MSNNVYCTYLTDDFAVILIAMIGAITGAGLLSKDLRANAIPLYLSRPVTKIDYLVGKATTVMIFLMTATLGPGLVLWITSAAVGTEEIGWGARLVDLGSLFVNCLVITLPIAALVLAFSSLSRKPTLAAIYWMFLYITLGGVGTLLTEQTGDTSYSLLVMAADFEAVGRCLYQTRVEMPSSELPGTLESLLVLGGLISASVLVLWARLRRFEEA
jgi:ABC-2 type transport system permease protein